MFIKSISNMKISQKILTAVLIVSFIAQISTGILAYTSILKLTDYSEKQFADFGTLAVENSESALKNQSETYLKKISSSLADVSDSVFEEISDQVNSLSLGSTEIYKNKENFNGHNLPLPENTAQGNRDDRTSGHEKAFAIDTTSNRPKNSEDILTYSPQAYPNFIHEEIKLLSNVTYISKPIYTSNPAVSSVYIGTESGIYYYYDSDNSPIRFDPRERPWYTQAVSATNGGSDIPVWQSTYTSKTNNVLCITCSKAFKDENGKILGVAAIDMYLDDVNQYILDAKIGDTGYAFVTNQDGDIIMHPQYKTSYLENENSQFDTHPLQRSDTSQTYKNTLSNMKQGKSGTETAEIDSKNYYISYSPLSTTRWSLGVVADAQEITLPAEQTKTLIGDASKNANDAINNNLIKISIAFIVIFAVFSAVVYVIGVKFVNDIIKPIKKLRNQAQKIGAGDFSTRLPVNTKDEIGDLSKSFNKMTDDLVNYMENLKVTISEKEKIHSELMVAKKIQRSMLPCIFPAFPDRKDFDIYALMDPAKEVGGDFYDFFFIDKNNLALVIADVSGKGVSAALFMVIAKILLKNQLQSGYSPEKTLEYVNNRLCENNEAGMFVTAFIGIVNIKTGEFTFANAGHNPPLIYKQSEEKYKFINDSHGFVLGGMPNMKYNQNSVFLQKEDLMFLYTDGVTEAMNAEGKLFSKKKLEKILNSPKTKKLSIKELILTLRQEIDNFAGDTERSDDITMLAFKDFDIPNS